jgi:hypothetical protein
MAQVRPHSLTTCIQLLPGAVQLVQQVLGELCNGI